MASEIVKAAYRERERLLDDLSTVPVWHKLQKIERLIVAYEAFEASGDNAGPKPN